MRAALSYRALGQETQTHPTARSQPGWNITSLPRWNEKAGEKGQGSRPQQPPAAATETIVADAGFSDEEFTRCSIVLQTHQCGTVHTFRCYRQFHIGEYRFVQYLAGDGAHLYHFGSLVYSPPHPRPPGCTPMRCCWPPRAVVAGGFLAVCHVGLAGGGFRLRRGMLRVPLVGLRPTLPRTRRPCGRHSRPLPPLLPNGVKLHEGVGEGDVLYLAPWESQEQQEAWLYASQREPCASRSAPVQPRTVTARISMGQVTFAHGWHSQDGPNGPA